MVLQIHDLGQEMDQRVKMFAEKTWSSGISPQNLCKGGRKEPTPRGSSLPSTYLSCHILPEE